VAGREQAIRRLFQRAWRARSFVVIFMNKLSPIDGDVDILDQ
jgi:hypothetical protein